MASKPHQSRRLSLSFFSSGPSPNGAVDARPHANPTNSIVFPSHFDAQKLGFDQKVSDEQPPKKNIRRKLSKKRRPKDAPPPSSRATSPPRSAFSSSDAALNESIQDSEMGSKVSLSRKRSLNLRVALSSIFVPKPSSKKVAGFIDGMEGISGGKATNDCRGRKGFKDTYCSYSRSPSPPSPEIRPPSGLGQIADSVDFSSYAQEDYEASIIRSRSSILSNSHSRPPSIAPSASFLTTDDVQTTTDGASSAQHTQTHMRSATMTTMTTEPDFTLLSDFPSIPPLLPSPASPLLVDALKLAIPYCERATVSSLARISRKLLQPARSELYSEIDSDTIPDVTKKRRNVLQSVAGISEIANIVRKLRWVCPSPSSPLPPSTNRTIKRRTPTISISSSPEEYLLPRVLSSIPSLETLELIHPPSSLLQIFIPVRRSPASPISPSPSSASLPPQLSSLTSLTLSGRTTLSSTFGSVLIRFLELHPNIRELALPDVFCLPDFVPSSLSSQASTSSSLASSPALSPRDSPSQTPNIDVPPVPPLPLSRSLSSNQSLRSREIESSINLAQLLPNLETLTVPFTLVTQLVPGRPLKKVDIEINTSLYEGLRPSELARALAAGDYTDKVDKEVVQIIEVNERAFEKAFDVEDKMLLTPTTPTLKLSSSPTTPTRSPSLDWKAARQARRAGRSPTAPSFVSVNSSSTLTPPETPNTKADWRAAREARRSGKSPMSRSPSLLQTPSTSSSMNANLSASTRSTRKMRSNSTLGSIRESREMDSPASPKSGMSSSLSLSSKSKPRVKALEELRLRCTAKVDGRTLDKVLNALASELGRTLEKLAVGWAGSELDLHLQLTSVLPRFSALKSIELFSSSPSLSDEEGEEDNGDGRKLRSSIAEFQATLALERQFVEQWSRVCPNLTYMEFASQRVWKSKGES